MLSWFGKGKKNVGGGYRKDKPPEDDCCPICFDDFHVPCRTNCAHWFCGSCLLRLSRFMVQLCKCPMCESWIYNPAPHSPLLIQPGREEEVGEILGEIEQFNRVYEIQPGREEVDKIIAKMEQYILENELGREEVDKIVAEMEQHIRENKKYADLTWCVGIIIITAYIIVALMQSAYAIYDFRWWPNEGIEFRLFQMLRCALLVLKIWIIWRNLRRLI